MPRFAVKTGLAQALAFGMLLFLSPLDAKSLRGTDNRILPAEDKAITTTTAPEEDKGVITNALVGAGAAWATGGDPWQGAIGGALTSSPLGAAAGGYLGGSKEAIPEGDKAVMMEAGTDKSENSDAVVAVGAAYASAIGGALSDAAAPGVGNGGARRRSLRGARRPRPRLRKRTRVGSPSPARRA
jgi:hypothetical protein